jgi:carbonic anhydrase
MIYRARTQTAFLILGLILSLSATAEEQKAAAVPATATKPAPATTAKPAAAVETAKPAPADTTKPAAAVAAPKPAAATTAVEHKQVEAPAPQHPRVKPYMRPAPLRVALATKTVPVKGAESPAAAQVAPAAAHTLHWSYEGETGPHAWARLAPEFAKCGSGERQSPIDIRDGMQLDLEPITFEYRPSSFKVIDNGHTIQANVNGWNSMRVMGRRFRLVQFHFHKPSEEMIDGRQYEMVVHLVHKDSEGRLAVVAVLVDGGKPQPAIQTVLNNLPLEKGEEVTGATNLDLAQLLPANRTYFTYMGSLTTPPCTEDVLWVVMKQPVQASADQLNLFSRIYPMNARPIQASSGRMIKESN